MAYFDVFNIRKPGKGVEKNEYTPRFPLYFELLWAKLWMMCKTNLMYLASCAPVIFFMWLGYSAVCTGTLATLKGVAYLTLCTVYLSVVGVGVFMPGLAFLTRAYARREHVWIFSDYKDKIIENIKGGLLLFAADTAILYVSVICFSFYGSLAGDNKILYVPLCFLAVCLLVYFMMHFYIYQVMATFDLRLRDVLKDSLIMTVAHFPWNLLILVLVSVFSFLLYLFNITIGITIGAAVAVTVFNYTISYMTDPIIDRYLYIPSATIEENKRRRENK